MDVINLGGEGEIPNVINQQPLHTSKPGWRGSNGKTIPEMQRLGHLFLFGPNDKLPIDSESVDIVYTNNVRINGRSAFGPHVPFSEIQRILKVGAIWIHNGRVRHRKP